MYIWKERERSRGLWVAVSPLSPQDPGHRAALALVQRFGDLCRGPVEDLGHSQSSSKGDARREIYTHMYAYT